MSDGTTPLSSSHAAAAPAATVRLPPRRLGGASAISFSSIGGSVGSENVSSVSAPTSSGGVQ